MRFRCECGNVISNTSDNLPYSAHVIAGVDIEGYWEAWERRDRGRSLGALMNLLNYERIIFSGCLQDDWLVEREAVHRVLLESDQRLGFWLAKCFLSDGFFGLALHRVCKLMGELGACDCTPNARKYTMVPGPKARLDSTRCGARYAGRLLSEWVRDNDMRLSCGRAGDRYDNVVADSFFATLKNEMHCRRSFTTRAEARHTMVKFVEAYHNRRRPRSTIDCKVPTEVATAFFDRADFKPEGMLIAA